MPIDAVIFDMDGVLVDSEPLHFTTTNEVLARRGVSLEQGAYNECIGMDEPAFFALLIERFGLDEPPDLLARERLTSALVRLATSPLPPMEGVLELLISLQADGKALALASSATRAQVDLILDQLGITRLFSAIVTKDDVEHGKPAPDLFLEAARQLGLEPAGCLVIEDAVLGVEAARAAEMEALAFVSAGRDGAEHLGAGALAVLTSFSGMTAEKLEKLTES
ncbi:MAG: HAD superfamily hydrolase (TIGR01509 family) [Pseudohongiellaceae bacterium]|jgi:HAD superfamily hydrolase (TIGR01509 family)